MSNVSKIRLFGERAKSSIADHAIYQELYARSISEPEAFWAEMAQRYVHFDRPWDSVLRYDYSQALIRWFEGAKLNVCYNCIDRHISTRANKAALIWEGNEPGDTRVITYAELLNLVSRFANALKASGVARGDRVCIYMPMVPEAVMAMLACARIGAIHTVVFGGFSAEALRDRINDCACKVLITADKILRGPKVIALKEIADNALEHCPSIERVLVHERAGRNVSMRQGRDFWLSEELAQVDPSCQPESMEAEDPLFILYTSGSTGKPKGVLHTQAGYLTYAAVTHRYVFDCREEDIYFCAADIGWVTGHSYIVYGPLANGASSVMFESVPTYPDAGRYWDVIERHGVNIFYTAPTAIRAVLKEGEELPERYDLSSLRVLGSVGEPINYDAWMWYYDKVGKRGCSVVDTWWQTETGGVLISPLAGVTDLKAGSATLPFFGIRPCLVDQEGEVLKGGGVKGRLCIEYPWPGQMRTVYGDHERFFKTYFSQFPGKYFSGDEAMRDEDGYYWIIGRVDDVVNVSGHRIGTAEVESAIIRSGIVAEAAVVPVPHEIKGQGILAFCLLRDGCAADDGAVKLIRQAVTKVIGAFAQPDQVRFVAALPKTRSGKIMRRILRKIAEGERRDFGDTSTLADPSVLQTLIGDATK